MTVDDTALVQPLQPDSGIPACMPTGATTTDPTGTSWRSPGPAVRLAQPAGPPAWLLRNHGDVLAALTDRRLQVCPPRSLGQPRLGPVQPSSAWLLRTEAPDHTSLRRWLAGEFGAVRIQVLRPRIDATANDLLDSAVRAGEPADLCGQWSRDLAGTVICDLIGVPMEDRTGILDQADTWLDDTGTEPGKVADAAELLYGYLAELLETRRARPADDLISRLVARVRSAGEHREVHVVAVALTALTAGYHTARDAIGSGLTVLLRAPDQYRRLCAQPELTRPAAEELLRFLSSPPERQPVRVAVSEVELAGATVQAGELVYTSPAAANRDPAVFTDPDRLNLGRTPNPHLTFGAGSHHCLGAELAREQLRAALRAVTQRLPSLALAAGSNPSTLVVWS